MHTVSCHISLPGISAQKFDVTPTELALLRSIHGDDAVSDVIPTADIERTDEDELKRLRIIYGTLNAPERVVAEFPATEPEATEEVEAEATDDAPKAKQARRRPAAK